MSNNQNVYLNSDRYQSLRKILLEILAVLGVFILSCLLTDNMAVNEVDVLPLAKQYTNPDWIPKDWYLNQPPGYRVLFQTLFGRLIVIWEFLPTSIVGRLICYCLVSWGLVLIARKLKLSLPLLLIAISCFLWLNQGAIAGEWIVGGLEAKAVAYGLVLLAIGLMLGQQYRLMAFILGLATSFHVLVGGYAFLTTLGWLIVRQKTHLFSLRYGLILLLYLGGSVFAIQSVLQQLVMPVTAGSRLASYIYVFLRLPHHLDPSVWTKDGWIKLMVYILILLISVCIIRLQAPINFSQEYSARIELFKFTLLGLVPFILGLAIARFDSQGVFLQFYPFRLGDVMLPLTTFLLFACALQQIFTRQRKRLMLTSIVVVGLIFSFKTVYFLKQGLALSHFPSEQQGVTHEWKNISQWIKTNTPKNAIFISSPVEFTNFSWMTERPTIAKFKLFPQNKSGILDWYERMQDLSGGNFPASSVYRGFKAAEQISTKYKSLNTVQVKQIMSKYQADYIMTALSQQLNLPIAYKNSSYILYKKRE